MVQDRQHKEHIHQYNKLRNFQDETQADIKYNTVHKIHYEVSFIL